MKKWIGIGVVSLAVAGIGFAVAQRAQETIDARANLEPGAQPPPAVEVAPAATRTFQPSARATGELLPLRTVQVHPKVGGTVVTIGPDLGADVRAGDALATLEADQLDVQADQPAAQRRAAATSVQQARVQRDAAKVELERAKQLYEDQAIAKSELDRAQASYDGAVAALNAATANVRVAASSERLADLSVEWTTVASPIDGVVTRRMADVGAMVGPSAPIYELQDLSELELVVAVPAPARHVLEIGQGLPFTVEGAPGRTFEGRIVAMSPSLDPATRRFRVKIRADGDQDGLMAHMFAEVVVPTGPAQTAPAAPRAARIDLEGGPGAFLVEDGVARRVRVLPDLIEAGFIALADEVAPGALVVVRGQSLVRDGAEVTVTNVGVAEADDDTEADGDDAASEPIEDTPR